MSPGEFLRGREPRGGGPTRRPSRPEVDTGAEGEQHHEAGRQGLAPPLRQHSRRLNRQRLVNRQRRGDLLDGGRGGSRLVVGAQDLLIQTSHFWTRVGAVLLGQPLPVQPAPLQRLGRASRRHQRPHQRHDQRLHQRVRVGQGGQLGQHRGGVADGQLGLGPLRSGGQQFPGQLLAGAGRPGPVHPGQRVTPAQRDGLPQQLDAPVGGAGRLPGLRDQFPEPEQVDLIVASRQPVTAGLVDHGHHRVDEGILQHPADAGDVGAERAGRLPGWGVAPDPVDEGGRRYHPVGVDCQGRENGQAAGLANSHGLAAGPDLHRPEKTQLPHDVHPPQSRPM